MVLSERWRHRRAFSGRRRWWKGDKKRGEERKKRDSRRAARARGDFWESVPPPIPTWLRQGVSCEDPCHTDRDKARIASKLRGKTRRKTDEAKLEGTEGKMRYRTPSNS